MKRIEKGFTLMEMLFVVLLIALVVSFSLPAIRAARQGIKKEQAKGALRKFSDARRSFYEQNRGQFVSGSFEGADADTYAQSSCNGAAASGVPGDKAGDAVPEQLFACGYLDWKDFKSLPYTFVACGEQMPCNAINGDTVYVYATATFDGEEHKIYNTTNNRDIRVAQ